MFWDYILRIKDNFFGITSLLWEVRSQGHREGILLRLSFFFFLLRVSRWMTQYSSKSFPNLYCHQYEFAKWAAWTTVTLSILIKKENFANLMGGSPFVKGAFFFFFSSFTFLSFLKKFYCLFFGCSGSLLLHLGFLWLLWVEATLPYGTQASHCGGFSHCGAWALATGISVVAAPGLSSCGTQA